MESPKNNLHPEISIIIVNYNSGDFLAGALQSILNYPPQTDWEVIIFDNASSDSSINKAKLKVEGNTKFKFIENNENCGFAAGNNHAVQHAKGEYFLLLNPDTEVTQNAIDVLLQYLKTHGDVGVVGARLVDSDNFDTVSFGYFPTIRGILTGAFLPKRFQSPGSGSLGVASNRDLSEEIDVGYVSGACFLTKRSIWNDLGGLDEKYFAYFEETDYCFRLHKKGMRVVHIPYVVVKHFEGRSFQGVPYRRMEMFVQSAMRFFNKHYSPLMKYFFVVINILASALKIIFLKIRLITGGRKKQKIKDSLFHHKAFLRALIKFSR